MSWGEQMGGARSGRIAAVWQTCDFVKRLVRGRKVRAAILGIAVLSLSAAATLEANAQSSVQPGTTQREFEKGPKAPRPSKTVTVPSLDTQAAPSDAENVKFVLKSIDIDGNTVLGDEALARPFTSMIGQNVSLAQIYAGANEITRMYANAGYALSLAFVPAQEVKDGNVRIRVVEGYIGEVEFQDERSFHSKLWSGFASRLKASRPLKTADLERYLLLANDLAGIQVKSVFERMEGDPGATKLVMMIERKLFDVGIEVNNRGSKAIGPVRVQGKLAVNGGLGAEERFSIFGVRVPDGEELSYLAWRFDVPLSSDGLAFGFDIARSHSKVGTDPFSSINFQTDGWTGNAGFTYPVIRSRSHNLYASLSVDYKDLTSEVGDPAVTNSHDTMTVIVAGVDYDTHDRWGGLLQAAATLHVGLDVFDATQSDDPFSSRDGASGEFLRLEGTASRLQSFRPWLHLYTQIDAQIADGALLVSEQCGYGGSSIGRGFDAFELAGDHCLKGLAELRYDVPLGRIGMARLLDSAQVYGLADFGLVFKSGDLTPGEERSQGAASLGLGMRMRALDYLSGLVEVDQPLGEGIALDGKSTDPRFYFGLSLDY
ncbi:MAG: POTRA domain-containing protein [Micropepsaceae bacterium]